MKGRGKMKRNEIRTKNLSRQEWLQLRCNGIGGSEVSVIMNVNKYRSIQQLWEEKTGRLAVSDSSGEPAYWGNVMEPIIRKEFMKRTGLKVRQKHAMIFHPDYDFMFADVDGIVTDENGEKCIFEAKTVSQYKAELWEGNRIPREYMLQVQHYLEVCGMKKAYVAGLIGGNLFVFRVVYRDEALIQEIVRSEEKFWNDYVLADKRPEMDGSEATMNFLNERYKESVKDSIQLDDSMKSVLEEYDKVTNLLEELEKKKTEITNCMREALQEHETGEIDGRVISWKKIQKSSFDSKRFRQDKPELFSQYQKDSSYRRLTVA